MKWLYRAWEMWGTGRGEPPTISHVQQARLANLVEFARAHSLFYRHLYQKISTRSLSLSHLPPVTKAELMASFDQWLTDSAVTRAGVQTFVTDKTLVGQLYEDRYAVWTTSGTTGTPGIFLHDREALAIYDMLLAMRVWPGWVTFNRLWMAIRRKLRIALVVTTGGHYAGVSCGERISRRYHYLSNHIHTFSLLKPLPELVQMLNHFQPLVLIGYPSALLLLASERTNGRLQIDPLFILSSGEWLVPAVSDQIEAAFNCPVQNMYGTSEFIYLAFSCKQDWLHVNADWLILEPVDEHYRPVPPGQASYTVLLTNLANHIQPLIRYDLGDSIMMRPEPCPCGNPLPAIRVEGRRDDTLEFETPDGQTVRLLPLALIALVEETPGVQRFQLIQTAPTTLTVRLEVTPGANPARVWELVASHLRAYLIEQHVPAVMVQQAPDPPRRDPISGKFRQVWIE